MSSWNDRIEAERNEAQEAGLRASDCESIGWDKLANANRKLVEACDRKIAALQNLKEITENYDLSTRMDDPEFRNAVKQAFIDRGLWPPKRAADKAVAKVLEAYDKIAYVGILHEETQLLPNVAEEEIRTIATGAIHALNAALAACKQKGA
jgi:hypothetical protein